LGKQIFQPSPIKAKRWAALLPADDVAVLRRIRQLLYVDGFTIKGAQKLVRSKASATKPNASVTASSASGKDLAAAMAMLDDVKTRLAALKQQLNH
jgi:DNA-binding transcriptional MerR regulator